MSVTSITSDTLLQDIEKHFRVSAGPGAGKTHWLVKHIKNVLHNSKRLGKIRKIACITYTNIAVDTILKRLDTAVDHVEVSTIHSFLYRNVLKPYLFLIAPEHNINVLKVDGHDDPNVSFRKVESWISNHPNFSKLKHPYSYNQLTKLTNYKTALIRWLGTLQFRINASTKKMEIISNKSEAYYIENGSRIYLSSACIKLLEADFWSYKSLYWADGIVHHDDVLFFSYAIIQNHPFVLSVLRAKFPYFYVDEFQDCNPIQIAILKEIAQKETIIGIIGDPAQSIYGFQGAEEGQFQAFNLDNLLNYIISNNRRSSVEIVDFITGLRSDITQTSERKISIAKPCLFVGERGLCLDNATSACGGTLYTLSRNNLTSNALKVQDGNLALNGKLFQEIAIDTNSERRRLVSRSVKAIALTREGKYKDALKEMQKEFKNSEEKNDGKSAALIFIIDLLSEYDQFKDQSLSNFIDILKRLLGRSISALRNGAPKTFYDSHTYQQLALCVNIPEDNGFHRTIHKSKGDEFDHVLLVLNEEKDLDFILNPNLLTLEEHRINYVAVSRARDRLFISTPSLSDANRKLLENKLEIVNI